MNRNINNNNNVTNSQPEHSYITIQSNASVSWGGILKF